MDPGSGWAFSADEEAVKTEENLKQKTDSDKSTCGEQKTPSEQNQKHRSSKDLQQSCKAPLLVESTQMLQILKALQRRHKMLNKQRNIAPGKTGLEKNKLVENHVKIWKLL